VSRVAKSPTSSQLESSRRSGVAYPSGWEENEAPVKVEGKGVGDKSDAKVFAGSLLRCVELGCRAVDGQRGGSISCCQDGEVCNVYKAGRCKSRNALLSEHETVDAVRSPKSANNHQGLLRSVGCIKEPYVTIR